ncbi:MAG: ABC transporter permease, partial [Pseudoflavonifractor sp.]
MNLRQSIKLAAKSIAARKGRTFLTMLGIIIGLAAVITLVTYASGTTKQMMELYESQGNNQVQVSAYKYVPGRQNSSIFDSLYNYCLQLGDLVVGVTPNQQSWGVTIKYGAKNSRTMENQPQVYMGSNQWSACNNAKIASGRDLSYLDVKSLNQVCVISPLVRDAFFNYADPIGQKIKIDGVPFTVVGVYEPRIKSTSEQAVEQSKWIDNYILLPYTTTRVFTAAGSHNFSGGGSDFIIRAKDAKSATEVITRLEGFLKGLIGDSSTGNSYGYFNIYGSNESIDYANEAARSQQMLLGGIAAISLLVGGIGIMNIMLV